MTTAVVRRLSSSAMSNRGLESASTHNTDIGNTMRDAKSTIVAERFKTRLCQKFEQTHACPYDTRCMFAHGSADLRTKEQNIRDDLVTEEAVKAFLKARALVAHAAAKKKERQRRRQKKKQEAKATSLANSVVSTRSPGDQRQLLRRDFDDDYASSDSSLCSAAQDDVADGDDAVAGSPTQARRNRFKSSLTASSNRQQPPPAPLTLTFVRGPNGTTAFANQQLPPSLSSVSISIEDAALRSGVFAASAQSAAIEAVCLERSGAGWTTSPAGAAHHHQQPRHHGSHRTTAPLRHHHHNGGQQHQHHRPELTAETPSTTYCAAASHQSPETASSAYDPSTPLISIPTARRSGPAAGGSGATTAPWILSASVQNSPAVRVGGLPVPLPTNAVTSPPAQQAMMMTMPRAACDTTAFRIHESYATDQGYGLVPTQPPPPATPASRTTHYRHDPYSVTRRAVRAGGSQQHQPHPAASSRRQSGDDDDGVALLHRSSSRTSACGQHTDSSIPTSASSSLVGVPAGCVPCLPRKPSTPLVDEECE